MKSNEKYIFSLIYYPRRCLAATQLIALVYNMDKWRICGKPEFNAIFLRLRWKLKDFDQIAGWGPV